MKKLFLLAWPIALAAVSCSNEEVVSVNNDANEIKFTAVVNKATRAADSYCNQTMPGDFNVWARVGEAEYFANVLYTQQTGNTYEAADGAVHFWPTSSTDVKFWAAKNHNNDGEGALTWPTTGAPTIKFKPAATASAQHDLLYAYTVQHRPDYGTNANGAVDMNFRHALSQIVFKAKVTNPTIKVQIDEVEVCRINAEGVFTYPTSATDDNYEKHDNGVFAETDGTRGTWGSWTKTGEGNDAPILTANYTTGQFTAKTITNSETATNLTDEETAHNAGDSRKISHSLLLLPQITGKWVHTAGTTGTGVLDAPNNTGAYFLVHCKIWNVSNNGSELLLWDNAGATKAVAIPVDINWLAGRKYIYTFNFGSNTTGGFDPDSGEDVLIPISFNVTVDDFVNVTYPEIGMN